jgi:hypothetical protein
MKRLFPLVVALLAGCGGATTPPALPAESTAPSQTAAAGDPATTTAPGATRAASDVVIPADCAAGFTDYLKQIEPVVAGFDPATAAFGEFYAADDAAGEVGIQLMIANDSRATYSCSEVGLAFAYFDTRSPWAAIHEIAGAQAPGTVAYLQVKEDVVAIDIAEMSDFEVSTCDEAVARITDAVAERAAAGMASIDDLSVDEGVRLLGLYNAYLAEVRAGNCPSDALANDAFGFMGTR